MLQIAEEKQHSDIVKLLTELMRTDSEMDIAHKDEEERDSEDKEAGMQLQQLEVASDDQEPSTRTGVWKRLKQRLQRNTQDIKLVSGARLATRYTLNNYCFYSTCRIGQQYVALCLMYRRHWTTEQIQTASLTYWYYCHGTACSHGINLV